MEIGVLRHGLERTAVREIAMDKRNRRTRIVRAVLDYQDDETDRGYHHYGARDGDDDDDDDDDPDEALRRLSGSISRPSRLFAQEMAVIVAETL